jgi:hypothetical protein
MRWLTGALIVIGLANCQRSTEEQERTLRSWIATARFAGHAWCSRDLSSAYLRETLAEVRDQLGDAMGEADVHDRGELAVRARHAVSVIDVLDRAAAQGDRGLGCETLISARW